MVKSDIYIEQLPIKDDDCFYVRHCLKNVFYCPLHVHREFELCFLQNVRGASRIVGDSVEDMNDRDLLLVAGGTQHNYAQHNWKGNEYSETSIFFHPSLFDGMINKRSFLSIKNMLAISTSGLAFSNQAIDQVQEKLIKIYSNGHDSFSDLLLFIEIMHTLSLDKLAHPLNIDTKVTAYNTLESKRLDEVMFYMHNNFHRSIQLEEIASIMNMSKASFMRFLKKWTGKTFVEILNDIRIKEASDMLSDSNSAISEICYHCGFNNVSNFNRIFKNRTGCSPTDYRRDKLTLNDPS